MTPDYQSPKPAPFIGRFIRHTIEAMLFILLCLIMSTIGQPRRSKHAKFSAAQADMSNLQTALDAFAADTGRYPTATEGLQALVENPGLAKWKHNYLGYYIYPANEERRLPTDPWGNPYRYTPPIPPGKDCTLSSDGPDGLPNTSDDITPSTPAPWDFPW
jgi:general secretion pathway protein G